jgi:hypothetical protein
LEFGCQQQACKEQLVNVVSVDDELAFVHVVSVNVDDCNDEALFGELSEAMYSSEKLIQFDVGDSLRIENGVAGCSFFDEIV